jgi:hypothetical protein
MGRDHCPNCGGTLEPEETVPTVMRWFWCDQCAADQHTYHPRKEQPVLSLIITILIIVALVAIIVYFVRRTPRGPRGGI